MDVDITALLEDADNGGTYAPVGQEVYGKISTFLCFVLGLEIPHSSLDPGPCLTPTTSDWGISPCSSSLHMASFMTTP